MISDSSTAQEKRESKMGKYNGKKQGFNESHAKGFVKSPYGILKHFKCINFSPATFFHYSIHSNNF